MDNVRATGAESDPSDYQDGIHIPPVFQECLDRHRRNLEQLVANLKAAGVAKEQIDASVLSIVESYKEELLRAVQVAVK